MTDTQEPENKELLAPAGAENTERTVPKERFNEVNEELKRLKKQVEDSEKANRDAQNAALAEQNRYKELYEALQKEVEPLRASAEKASRYESAIAERNQARIASIPKEKQLAVPPLDDPIKLEQWLDNAIPLLMEAPKPKAPNLDGGAGGNAGNGAATVLTGNLQSLADVAREMGYSVDNARIAQYAKKPQKASNTGDE